jgi:hypothetical protein
MTKLVVFAITLPLLLSAVASAQTIHVRANVPFNFIAGSTMFSAGQFEMQSTGNGDKVLVIRNLNSMAGTLVLSNSCESPNASSRTRLVFHRYGAQYFLAEVWSQGTARGHQLPTSSREEELAKDFSRTEIVLILAQK